MDTFLAKLSAATAANDALISSLEEVRDASLDNATRAMLEGAIAGEDYAVGSVLRNLSDQFAPEP